MKTLTKFFAIALVFGLLSCTDKKKEEAETKAAVEKIEAVEAEIDKAAEEVETKAKELEESLGDLDDI